ncbi:hypothetical protein [Escherichia coli]|uniref:hypothetical protein n=1 Tax=Escherichia coli TaxID=562 RepID=UPI00225C4137|nr:hypothetical protein [Escherichia coli]MCX3189140.1 hypothetical protein [Escherichia coli]
MSKAAVMAALKKARLAREGESPAMGGTGQHDFNAKFYGKSDTAPMSQKAFNANFYAGKS